MGKKSQIALFIIIGLVLLIGIVILISFKVRRDKEQVTERKAERLMLTLAGEKISYFVDDCIKEKLNEGIGSAGFSGAEQYVKQHLDECVDLSLFEEQGYEIEKDTSGIEVDLSYSDDYVTVSVRYPITISLENNKKELLTFYYRARRTIATGVFLDEYGYTDHAIVVPSPDGRATLTIPEGTRITDSSGQQFEAVEISLTPVDKREDGLGNEIVLGNLVYVLEPSGLHFEGPDPVQFSVHYYDSLLDGRDENSLSVMTYGDKGVWYGVPTVIDSGNNVATGELTHFSKVALGSCTDASSKIFTNYLFLEDCFLPGASLDDRASLGWSLVNGRLESGQGLQERQNTGYNHHREGNLLFFYEGSDLEHLGCYQEDGKWVYSSYQAVGGMGMLTFSFAPGSCIDQNSGHITITADNIIDLVEAGYVDSNGIVLEKATKQVNNNQITLTLADILQGNELFDDSYLNYIAVHVLNTEDSTDNNIGTARIWADISIEGTGFSLDSAANPEGVSPGLACSGDNAGRWCGEGRVCLSYDAEGPDYFGSDPAGYVCTGAGADTECPTMSALGLVGDCARQNGQPHCWLEDDAWVRDSSGNCMEQGGDCECVREVCRTTSGAYKVVYNGYKIADGEFDTDTCEQMRVRRQGETGGAGSPGSPGGGDSTCDTPGTYSDRGGDDCWYCYEGTWRQLNEEWSSCCGEGGCSCCDPDSLLKNHYAYVRSDEGEMECKKCQYYMGGVDAGSYNWGRTPASDPRCYEMFAEPVELGGTCPQGTDENLRDRVETDRIGGELLYVIKQGSEDCTCGDSALSYYINEFNPDGWPLPSLLYCCNNEFTSDEAGCGGTPNTPPGGGDIEYAPPLGYDWQLVETSFNSLEGQCERETFYHILEPQEVLLGTLLFNSRYFAYYFCGDSYLGEYASRSRGVDNKGEIYRLECVKHDLSIPDRDTNLENLQLCSPPACRNQIVLITGYGDNTFTETQEGILSCVNYQITDVYESLGYNDAVTCCNDDPCGLGCSVNQGHCRPAQERCNGFLGEELYNEPSQGFIVPYEGTERSAFFFVPSNRCLICKKNAYDVLTWQWADSEWGETCECTVSLPGGSIPIGFDDYTWTNGGGGNEFHCVTCGIHKNIIYVETPNARCGCHPSEAAEQLNIDPEIVATFFPDPSYSDARLSDTSPGIWVDQDQKCYYCSQQGTWIEDPTYTKCPDATCYLDSIPLYHNQWICKDASQFPPGIPDTIYHCINGDLIEDAVCHCQCPSDSYNIVDTNIPCLSGQECAQWEGHIIS